jgi:hypothetical protein
MERWLNQILDLNIYLFSQNPNFFIYKFFFFLQTMYFITNIIFESQTPKFQLIITKKHIKKYFNNDITLFPTSKQPLISLKFKN